MQLKAAIILSCTLLHIASGQASISIQDISSVLAQSSVTCPSLEDPNNGEVTCCTGDVGDVASYCCCQGYVLEGDVERTCQSDGTWSGTQPVCRSTLACTQLLDPANGNVVLSSGTDIGSVATYTCDTGYTMIGSDTRTCEVGGLWSGNAPVCKVKIYKDCKELRDIGGITNSGLQTINPDGGTPFEVYCDMVTDNGGWTVFQRRKELTPAQDFDLDWAKYAAGFGDLEGEFWLGLDHIHRLTAPAGDKNELRIDLEDFDAAKRHAKYSIFGVGDAGAKYKLTVGGYSGDDSGDSMTYHDGMLFTTRDQDNDEYNPVNCAAHFKGAWWFKACHEANLNGVYIKGGASNNYAEGVIWQSWKGYYYSLATTEMKVRRI